MILDKLLEKKDLTIYIDMRIAILSVTRSKLMKTIPEKERAMLSERFNGRILELCKMKEVIAMNTIKEVCKRYWRKCAQEINKG